MRLSVLLFTLCGCGALRMGPVLPATGGAFTHDGSIGAGQRVAFTQILANGRAIACLDGKKPAGVEIRGHLEAVRLLENGFDTAPLGQGDTWRAPEALEEWTDWCEMVGDLRRGDLVRLVSETGAVGVFRFRLTLRAP